MPCHIEIAERELAYAGISGVIVIGSLDLLNQFIGDFLTGLIMLRKRIQELFLAEEVLVELRGQFDEITRYGCTRLRGIVAACEHTVQAVTELVQEGFCLVVGQQRRLCNT